jgi:esterase
VKLNFKTLGNGEPLIILHGLLGSLDNWQTIAKNLAEKYTVFIVDQRNHGRSPHSDEFNYEILSDDLLNFMYENHLFNAHLLGHSMGGKVVMKFALDHPDMVNKLIVADIAPVEYPPGHDVIFEALHDVNLDIVNSRQEVEELLAKKIQDFGVRQFLMKGLTRSENNTFVWKFNLESLWKNYHSILSNICEDKVFDKDTLFIKGGKSRYILDEHTPAMEKHFPNYAIESIANAGHWLHAEQPEIFLKITSDFLEK